MTNNVLIKRLIENFQKKMIPKPNTKTVERKVSDFDDTIEDNDQCFELLEQELKLEIQSKLSVSG